MRNVFLFTILIMILLSGCRQTRYIPVQARVDSVYVEKTEIRFDTVRIKLPADTVYSISTDSSHLETNLSSSDAIIREDGKLFHTLINKQVDLEKEVVSQERVVEKIVTKDRPIPVEVEKPTPYVPGYYKTINKIFWFLISIIGGGIFLKIKRII